MAPYTENIKLPLMTEPGKLTADGAKRFESAVAFGKEQNFERACDLWRGLGGDDAQDKAVQFNLSICDEVIEGDITGALARLRSLEARLDAPDRMVTERMAHLNGLMKQSRTLKTMSNNERGARVR